MKRLLDVCIAAGMLVVFSPLLLLVAVAVGTVIGRPVLFRQQRPGRHGLPFRLVKFRTMSDATDRSGTLLPDDQRLSRFGQFLRSTSLDELPELWNVLRGEMSLVGPRPLLMEYLPRYTANQARRHEVRPGVTGLAQIRGRNALGWEEQFALDVWYVDNHTMWLDLQIIGETLGRVLTRRDIAEPGHVTRTPFQGSGPS